MDLIVSALSHFYFVSFIIFSFSSFLFFFNNQGLASILEDGASTVSDILQGINDPAVEVRRNVYECLLQVSRTLAGVNTCVGAGVTAAFVNAIGREDDALKVLLLKTIYNIVGSNQGREDAVAADAVKICIGLLSRDEASSQSASATTANAARTLGFLCYDEEAKVKAIEGNAVSILFSFLSNSSVSGGGSIKTEVTMALMAITSTDEGKRQIMACNGVDTLVSLLNDDSRVLRLNSLKVIANAAVFPPIRARLLADHGCLVLLNRIKDDSSDSLLQRHAGIALAAVNWTP